MAVKVLLIEDDTTLAKMYQAVLTKIGYSVVVASDGEEGLKMVKSEKPNLVLLDVMLPKIGGMQVLEAMKKDPAMKAIPVIVLTSTSRLNDAKDVKAKGAAEYMDKTLTDPNRVAQVIAGVLKK